ncbi:Receptor-like protein kinase [Quillaja saponaria]|uniref:Receptor-like protein kinase n=1 Tax=Quillaja saponaria TaxID=32244 RepID=A0AAD7LBT4_QUISA|nr:Receptor-like protein kinase [Quillaja saponaria]
MKPEYYDAILNGMRYLSLMTQVNLAGPNPVSSQVMLHAQVIEGSGGGAAGFVFAAAVCIVESGFGNWLPLYGSTHASTCKSSISGNCTVGIVLWNLEFALRSQHNPSEGKHIAEEKANDAYAMHKKMLNIAEDNVHSKETDDLNTSFHCQLFLKLVNPKSQGPHVWVSLAFQK